VAAPTASLTGDQARAVTHAKQALELGRRTGSPSGIASSLFAYGLTMRTEDPRAARAALEESIALVERGASPVVYGYALLALALLRAEAGEYAYALRALHDALRYAADTANWQLSEQILALALPVLADVGAPALGVTLVPSSSLERAEAANGRETRTGADESHAALESMRRALGHAGFARARDRGEAMSPRETVDYALAEFDRLLTELGAGDA
jgi:hypothetical protein